VEHFKEYVCAVAPRAMEDLMGGLEATDTSQC
jgi:hypothetical protein